MPHDKQVVIGFLTGCPTDDAVIKNAVKHLMIKWDSVDLFKRDGKRRPALAHFIHCKALSEPHKGLPGQLSELGTGSRLYICGHGHWASNTCAGLSGKQVAEFLAENKLSKSVGLVSVIACDGAIADAKKDAAAFISLNNTRFSFVYNFHFYLGEFRIMTVCHGRVGSVSVGRVDEVASWGVDIIGRKDTKFYNALHEPIAGHSEDWTSHRPKSKVVFYWKDSIQKMTWADAPFLTPGIS